MTTYSKDPNEPVKEVYRYELEERPAYTIFIIYYEDRLMGSLDLSKEQIELWKKVLANLNKELSE